MAFKDIPNKAAPNTSYFTPAQEPPAGTAADPQPDGSHPPKLFQPLTLRGVTFQNRIFLSPMCQYSAEDGHHTDWHFAHLGGIMTRGPGLTMVEATAVLPEGRITPEDSGLWKDSQIEPLRRFNEFAHSQGQKTAIQLGHGGRKASTVAPWLAGNYSATNTVNGWLDNVVGPSAIKWGENMPPVKEMSLADIETFKKAFVDAAKRAVTAGFDVIEIHNAHGYLLHEFVSPIANKRTDQYGGSFENRTRLSVEVVDAVRAAIPDTMPLFLRISATDYLEEVPESEGLGSSWTVPETVRFAELVAAHGVDLLDVSGGGMHPKQHPHAGPAYQAPFAKAVKDKVGDKLAVTTVGMIETGAVATRVIDEDGLDGVSVGRPFLKNPGLVWAWADELGIDISKAAQIRWGFAGRGSANKK